jgi:tetratricopeptide (TPR) repeat protein
MKRIIIIAFILIAPMQGLAVAAPTSANVTAEKQARKTFQSAEAHFKAGLFAEALGEYQAGYEVYPLPGFLINIAQCQRRLGDLEKARATYRKFVMVAPDSPFVPEVKSLVEELDKLLADLDATKGAPASLEPTPATVPVVTVPAPSPAPAEPKGTSLVEVSKSADPPSAGATRWWLWGTVGVVVAAAATTAVILLRSPDTVILHDGSVGTLRR